MNIDGKEKVKERIKIFESDDFTTYLYKFENGNKYKDTVPAWKRKDFGVYVHRTPEDKIESKIGTYF
jgi:hypothetical protein